MNSSPHPGNNGSKRPMPQKRRPPQKNSRPPKKEDSLPDIFREIFSKKNFRRGLAMLKVRLKSFIGGISMHVFYSRERIFCGGVTALILIFLALLQTTVFSTIRPFGAIPDMMLSFTLALSVTEGRKWGAVWGIIAAVIIESLSIPDITLLPLLYMPVGFFCGILCKYYYTDSAAVRAVLTLAVLPLRGIFTAVYMAMTPLSATAGEIFFEVILPELAATLLLAAPIHVLLYFCLKPFHHTRADMVSEK